MAPSSVVGSPLMRAPSRLGGSVAEGREAGKPVAGIVIKEEKGEEVRVGTVAAGAATWTHRDSVVAQLALLQVCISVLSH